MGLPQEVAAQEWPLHLSQNINIYLWFRTNKINKVDPFLALVNLVRENNSTDVMNMNDNLPDVEECDSEQEEYSMDCESDSDSSDSTSKRSDYPCPFCHTRRRLLSTWKICSGTDPEPEVLKLICPYCQQTFETYDKIEKHIGIHIMR